ASQRNYPVLIRRTSSLSLHPNNSISVPSASPASSTAPQQPLSASFFGYETTPTPSVTAGEMPSPWRNVPPPASSVSSTVATTTRSSVAIEEASKADSGAKSRARRSRAINEIIKGAQKQV